MNSPGCYPFDWTTTFLPRSPFPRVLPSWCMSRAGALILAHDYCICLIGNFWIFISLAKISQQSRALPTKSSLPCCLLALQTKSTPCLLSLLPSFIHTDLSHINLFTSHPVLASLLLGWPELTQGVVLRAEDLKLTRQSFNLQKDFIFFCFIYDLMPFSQIISPSPSPTESKRLFYTSVSLLLSRMQGYCYHLSKFHMEYKGCC